MYRRKSACPVSVFMILLIFSVSNASALEIEPGIGAGLQYSDNAGLDSDNEQDDWIGTGYVGVSVKEDNGPVSASLTSSLTYQNYKNDTFGNQRYFKLSASGGWVPIKNRLSWSLRNYFTQQAVNSIDANTPDNTQNTNTFTFGPDITFPISPRQRINLTPRYNNFYYENSDTDNQQYSLLTSWSYQALPTMNVSLNWSYTNVVYDDEDLNPNYKTNNVYFGLSGERARSNYRLSLGRTSINRDQFDDETGFFGNLRWVYNITGRSSVQAYAATELTDTSTNLLQAQIDPITGDFTVEQISGDVIRNNIIRLEYDRKGTTLGTRVWGEARDLDYKESLQDREVRALNAEANYRINDLLTSSLYARYNRTKETDIDRRDKRYIVGSGLSYRLSRQLRSEFDIHYTNKDSTQASAEYSEFGAFIGLVWGFGNVPHARGITSF